jgi:hypothetical protein
VLEFRVPASASFESVFSATPVVLTPPVEGQGEAITYAQDGKGFYTISEAKMRPLHLLRGTDGTGMISRALLPPHHPGSRACRADRARRGVTVAGPHTAGARARAVVRDRDPLLTR